MNLPTVLLIKAIYVTWRFYMPLFSLRSNRMHGFTLMFLVLWFGTPAPVDCYTN